MQQPISESFHVITRSSHVIGQLPACRSIGITAQSCSIIWHHLSEHATDVLIHHCRSIPAAVPHIPQKADWRFEVAMPATGLRRFVNAFATLQPTVKVQGFRSRLVSGLKSFQLPWDDEGDLYDVPYSKRRDMLVMGSIDGDVFKHVSP